MTLTVQYWRVVEVNKCRLSKSLVLLGTSVIFTSRTRVPVHETRIGEKEAFQSNNRFLELDVPYGKSSR